MSTDKSLLVEAEPHPVSVSVSTALCAPLERLWQRRQFAAASVLFWFVLLSMVAVRAFVGMDGSRYCSHDAFMVLDGAWRMVNGQRPHVDFNSMIGPAAYLPTVAGFALASNTAAGFGYGQALMALILGVWTYALTRPMSEVPRVLYSLCISAIAISPGQIGLSPFVLTPGMTYNRYSYALLGILLYECLTSDAATEFLPGFSTGAVIAILAFTKITSFAVGVILLITLLLFTKQSRKRLYGVAGGAVLIGLAFLFYLHFDVISVIRDIALTAAAKHVNVMDLYILSAIGTDAGTALLLAFAASALLKLDGDPRTARMLRIAGIIVVIASGLMIFGNWQQSDLPLVTLFLLVLSHFVSSVRSHQNAFRGVVLGGAAIFAGVTLFCVGVSLIAGTAFKIHTVPRMPAFTSPVLHDFVPVGDDVNYTNYVNDGFNLLSRYRKPGESIMSLDFSNPFSYGLLAPPAPGGSTNLQYRGSFNEVHKVSPEKLFGYADLVMLPKDFSDLTLTRSIPAIYGPYLESHFRMAGESYEWKLYRRIVLPQKPVEDSMRPLQTGHPPTL